MANNQNLKHIIWLLFFIASIFIESCDDPITKIETQQSKIVFVSDRDGNKDIFLMELDGSNQTKITNHDSSDWNPEFSKNGQQLVFQSNRNGNSEIYVMGIDGSNLQRVTSNSYYDCNPSFSPNGSKIVFGSLREDGYRIYIIDSNGNNEIQLSFPEERYLGDWYPVFSPDGTVILFYGWRDGSYSIIKTIINTGAETILTDNQGQDYFPQFSNKGNNIIFDSSRDNPNNIYIINSDGTALQPLINNGMKNRKPLFSPDNTIITFYSTSDSLYYIKTLDLLQNIETIITSFSWSSNYPYYNPDPQMTLDNEQIIFYSEMAGNGQIFSSSTDSENIINISNNLSNDEHPRLQPLQ
ncbi:MAG: PD40 domain-containing protein [Candidatus Marinimicrobia bacterium]|nr:PD40 domain-containing protein [Candidatus Neomarinimicrobiota bacterium]